MRALRCLLAVILALLLTACATTPPVPPAPTWTERYLYTSYAARRGIY